MLAAAAAAAPHRTWTVLQNTRSLLRSRPLISSMALPRAPETLATTIGRCAASSSGGPGPTPQTSKPQGPPGLIGPGGAPLPRNPTGTKGSSDPALGPEVELTAQNASQVLQSPSPLIMQVGAPDEAMTKKIGRLRVAANGKLPVVKLDCTRLPQICEALQIRSSPAAFLMAKGQVAAALEHDLSAQAVTGFVEKCAQMLGLKVDLAEGVTEQLAEAEQEEWNDAASAEAMFANVNTMADLPQAARLRATAGLARCAIWQGRAEAGSALIDQLVAAGHEKLPEVTQCAALKQLDELRSTGSSAAAVPSLESLKSAAEADPTDVPAAQAYAVALFWSGVEEGAVDAGLKLLRRKRSDEARKLVLMLIEALGPRHPRSTSARKSFNSALFA